MESQVDQAETGITNLQARECTKSRSLEIIYTRCCVLTDLYVDVSKFLRVAEYQQSPYLVHSCIYRN